MPDTEEEIICKSISKDEKSGSVCASKESCPISPQNVLGEKTWRTYENQSRCSKKSSRDDVSELGDENRDHLPNTIYVPLEPRCSSKYSVKSDDTAYSAEFSPYHKPQCDNRAESQETVAQSDISRPIAESSPDFSEPKLGSASQEIFGTATPGPSGFSGKSCAWKVYMLIGLLGAVAVGVLLKKKIKPGLSSA